MKKWMVVQKNEDMIVLHHNDELIYYEKFKRVPDWIVKRYLI
jgi:hypothetical protein